MLNHAYDSEQMTAAEVDVKMADPKFANLPGIAYDQSDLYETSDLPEADQANLDIDNTEETDGIENLNLDAKAAYKKFKDKTLIYSAKTDFSDRIGHQRRIGYEALSGEYSTEEVETPQQKYLRLQNEIESLKKVLTTKPNGDLVEQKELPNLIVKVGELNKQLLDLKLENVLGVDVMKNISDSQGTLPKKLISDLEAFKQAKPSSEAAKSSKEKEAGAKSGEILYELHYQPEISKFNQNTKLGELEHRMQLLETIVGKDVEKAISLAGDTNNRSIMGAISVLNSKLNLLEPTHIDQVDAHLTALSLRLTQVADKKSQLEESEKINKISEAYQLLKKSETLCVQLPDIVNRMASLKELHEQVLQFSTALAQLDSTQQQIISGVKNDQDLLTELRQEFAKNMEIIKSNVTSLDQRVAALRYSTYWCHFADFSYWAKFFQDQRFNCDLSIVELERLILETLGNDFILTGEKRGTDKEK